MEGNMLYSANGSPRGPIFAKAIVLGDPQTGRRSLLHHLAHETSQPSDYDDHAIIHSFKEEDEEGVGRGDGGREGGRGGEDDFFLPIELTAEELDGQQSVLLKLWAYTDTLSKKDEEFAFRGSLFTIVMFNICDQDSFRSVFEKWIPVKETLSPDSFLIVLGSHLDESHLRAVSMEEISKCCAKKDAIYIELSNVTKQNVPLLRRLIARRVVYMLRRREELASLSPHYQSQSNSQQIVEKDESFSEEKKQSKMEQRQSTKLTPGRASFQAPLQDISLSCLEPVVMTDSVASILASCFGLDSWRSFEEHSNELREVGGRIENLLQELADAADNVTAPGEILSVVASASEDFLRQEAAQSKPLSDSLKFEFEEEDLSDLQAHRQELADAFRIMGLAPPPGLLQNNNEPITSNAQSSIPEDYLTSNPHRPNLRKMLVRLPNGIAADMVLDLEGNLDQQIDLFMLSHSLGGDEEARKKLLQITSRVQRDYLETSSRSRSVSSRSSVHSSATSPLAPR
eukprot:gene9278-10243_t